MSKNKESIIIHINGGLVNWVFSIKSKDPNKVIIVDTDVEELAKDVTVIKDIFGNDIMAKVYEMPIVSLCHGEIENFVKAFLNKKAKE